jgi:CRISPR/Cas system-associated exonuclease Cas4 (RecB family)
MSYDKAISYSGLSLYRKCPKAWHDAYVLGNRSEAGAAANRGTEIHKEIEDYFNGLVERITHSALHKWKAYFFGLAPRNPVPEMKLGACSAWSPMAFDDATANVRGAMDLVTVGEAATHIIDWKTGKVYPEHEKQADFYAALSAAYHKQPTVVTMAYIDQSTTTPYTYSVGKCEELQGKLGEEIAELRLVEEYPATPNPVSCRWCNLSWRVGGTCRGAP